MSSDSSTDELVRNDASAQPAFHRLFYVHVSALVLTATVIIPLLLGIASIPPWVSLAYCAAIIASAIFFMLIAAHRLRSKAAGSLLQRAEQFSVIVGLALAQVTFVIPVLICVYAPSLRL